MFRTGALCSVVPIFVLLALYMLPGVRGVAAKLGIGLPSEADFSHVFLPVLNMVTAYGWCINVLFHFWLREKQTDSCMLLSGHWYTFAHTIAAGCLVLVFFFTEREGVRSQERVWTRGPNYIYFQAAYLVMYIAIAMNTVLRNSQRFHHDAPESDEGLRQFAYYLIVPVVVSFIALWRSLASLQSATFSQKRFTKGQGCEVVADHKGPDGSVCKGDACLVTENQDASSGWVQVVVQPKKDGPASPSTSYTPCWVPAHCLALDEDMGVAAVDDTAAKAGLTGWAKLRGVVKLAKEMKQYDEGKTSEEKDEEATASVPATSSSDSGSSSDGGAKKVYGGGPRPATVPATSKATAPAAGSSGRGGGVDDAGGRPRRPPMGGLLADLSRDNKKSLKKTTRAALESHAKRIIPKNPLLAALESQNPLKRLKKAPPKPKQAAPPPKPGLFGELEKSILARRINIRQDEDDDEDGDDEWNPQD